MGAAVARDARRGRAVGGGRRPRPAAGRHRRARPLIRLATVVQHHPARAHLLDRIRAEIPDAVAVTDPDLAGTPNAWRCYRACLDALPVDASHLLILQDDAIPCRHFATVAHAALAARPVSPVAFFVAASPRNSARHVTLAAGVCRHWADLDRNDWVPAVALCLPRHLVDDLSRWADARTFAPHRTSDDAILGEWIRDQGHTVAATVPNLVQHDDFVPSLMGNTHLSGRNPARIAVCWIGDHDGRTIRW